MSKTEAFQPILMCQMSLCCQIDGYRKSELSIVKLVKTGSQLVNALVSYSVG